MDVYVFWYTEAFTVPETGTYQLEVWGASGGSLGGTAGNGGYATAKLTLTYNSTIYVVVGSAGNSYNGGYNGGGNGGESTGVEGSQSGAGGGGATHIATATGTLETLRTQQSSILIVAGGGGGTGVEGIGGVGGGTTGGNGYDTYNDDYNDFVVLVEHSLQRVVLIPQQLDVECSEEAEI